MIIPYDLKKDESFKIEDDDHLRLIKKNGSDSNSIEIQKLIEVFTNSKIVQGKHDNGVSWSIYSILDKICSQRFVADGTVKTYKSKYLQ